MTYVIIILVIVINAALIGFCLYEYFKKRFREKLEKELLEILYQATRLDEQLKKAFGDIPQFSKQLSDEITPFVKSYVAEAIDKYVAEEQDKLRDFMVPAEVQYPDAIPLANVAQHFNSFQEIDEAVCRRSQDAVATGCRQGRRMQEDTGPLGPGLLPLEDDYFQGRQGQSQAAVHRRDRRHARMEGIGQFPVSQAVRIDTDCPQGRRIAVHGDDEEAIFGGLAEDILSPFDDPGKGEDVAVGIEGDEAARL